MKPLATESDSLQTLTPQQTAAAALVARGLSDNAVAQNVGCSRSTVLRWRNGNDAFRAAVHAESRCILEEAAGAFLAAVRDAVDYAHQVIRGNVEADPNRLRAAALFLGGLNRGQVGEALHDHRHHQQDITFRVVRDGS